MNRAIMGGSIIVGMAVMLSLSMMPANAEEPDNYCMLVRNGAYECNHELIEGQHVLLNFVAAQGGDKQNSPACHYDVEDLFGVVWVFTPVHGPSDNPEAKCENSFGILKTLVTVRGQNP